MNNIIDNFKKKIEPEGPFTCITKYQCTNEKGVKYCCEIEEFKKKEAQVINSQTNINEIDKYANIASKAKLHYEGKDESTQKCFNNIINKVINNIDANINETTIVKSAKAGNIYYSHDIKFFTTVYPCLLRTDLIGSNLTKPLENKINDIKKYGFPIELDKDKTGYYRRYPDYESGYEAHYRVNWSKKL